MDPSDMPNRVPNRLCHLYPYNQKQTLLLLLCHNWDGGDDGGGVYAEVK